MVVVMLLVGRRWSMVVIGSVDGVSCMPGSVPRVEKSIIPFNTPSSPTKIPLLQMRLALRGSVPCLGVQSQPMAEQVPCSA